MRRIRGVLTRGRWLAAILLAVCALGVFAPAARADGDPASDVLVYQNLFATSASGMSAAQQEQVANLLVTAGRDGFPIRVAIIGAPVDLGAITALWGKPAAYANFLGIELSLIYKQRLLIVMPAGFGFDWTAHPAGEAAARQVLAKVPIGTGGTGLTTTAIAAVRTLAAVSGVKLPAPAVVQPAAVPHGGVTTRQVVRIGLIVLAALVVADVLFRLARRFSPRLVRRLRSGFAGLGGALAGLGRRAWRRPVLGSSVVACLVLAAGGVAFAVTRPPSPVSQATLLARNASLDAGRPLSGAAPGFTLTGQSGQPVSLRSYRGDVVLLTFGDPRCTAGCPLASAALLDAKTMLGAAGSRVRLVGIDANLAAAGLAAVRSYSQAHGMASAWQFLTGPPTGLRSVAAAYSIGVTISQREVDDAPPIFVIAPDGALAKLYLTRPSYAAVGQLGQLLAAEAASLLPGHPPVRSHLSYARMVGTSPAETTTLPRAQGGTVAIGPGQPAQARLYLFAATWDQPVTGLATQLKALNGYQLAAGGAGLPSLTVVDEGGVEPSPAAMERFLKDLKAPLWYQVGVDRGGQVADGYQVRGVPWFVLVSPAGQILWSWDVSASGWLSPAAIDQHVRAALARAQPG